MGRARVLGGLLAAALVATTWTGVAQGTAAPGHTVIPTSVPVAGTPGIDNGQVNGIAEVGTTIVAGGTFSSVTPSGGSSQARSGIVAFDAETGALRTGFNPALNGAVQDVLPGPTAGTVYVAGNFTTVNGAPQSHVSLLDVATGTVVTGFRPAPTNGVVNALALVRGRLVLGGNFTLAGGVEHRGLASLDPRTGAIDPWMGVDVTERHNDSGSGAQGAIGVRDLEATSTGSAIVAIGNFKRADGLMRDQLVLLEAGSSSVAVDPDWRTRRYEPYCFNWAFDTYVRGVAISPDDTYFVVTTTGGHNPGTLCDTAARFEIGATGDAVQPSWVDYTGGDTLWSVEVTENAVYVGGHQRWMNNSDASDTNGQGATPRPGLAALDPSSGLPIAWNPGRNPRGAAAFALLATPSGLWVGSDTEYFGNFQHRRPRIARFRLAGGAAPHPETTPRLPADVLLAGSGSGGGQGNVLHRVNAGGPSLPGIDGGPAWSADTAATSAYHGTGSSTASWDVGATRDATVPASTPPAVFDSERYGTTSRMRWTFPVPTGAPLQVRLYFANRCTCTAAAGSRVFDVDVEGRRVLDDFDVVAAVGDQRGTMRAFDVTGDGSLRVDFLRVKETPVINAIEVVRRDQPAPTPVADTLRSVQLAPDGQVGPVVPRDARGVDWGSVRGAFMVGDTLVTASTDGYLYRRTFTTTTTGAATRIDPYNDPAWNDVSTGSGNTYRGRVPTFYGQIPGVTGIYYADDRIYYTRSGSSALAWRWFNADSGVVGSQEFTAATGTTWSDSAGLFRDGDTLYVVSRATGDLRRTALSGGVPTGSTSLVDATVDWRANAVFVGPGGAVAPPPPPPPVTPVSHVATAGATANSAAPAVSVPASVQAGDQLVLVGTYGLGDAGVGDPAGWTRVARRQNGSIEGIVWTRRATAADAGASVTTPLATTAKSALTLGAYRGVASSGGLAAVVDSVDSGTASHVSPTVAVPAGGWTLQVWTDKSSSTTAWTAPAGVTTRTVALGSGAGRVTALVADDAGAAAGATGGGLTATTDAPSGKGISWTIALRAAS